MKPVLSWCKKTTEYPLWILMQVSLKNASKLITDYCKDYIPGWSKIYSWSVKDSFIQENHLAEWMGKETYVYLNWYRKKVGKIQHPCIIKVSTRNGRKYLCIVKAMCKKSQELILKVKYWKFFFCKIGKKTNMPPLPLLFNTVMKVVTRAIRKEK
jgi:hypothetical protein